MINDTTDPRFHEKEERSLLTKLYEVQEQMLPLIDGGAEDPDFIALDNLVKRLEIYLQDQNQMLI